MNLRCLWTIVNLETFWTCTTIGHLWGVNPHYFLDLQFTWTAFCYSGEFHIPFSCFDFCFQNIGAETWLLNFWTMCIYELNFWFELMSQTTCELSSKLVLIINCISLTVVMIAIDLTTPPNRWSHSYQLLNYETCFVFELLCTTWTIWNYKGSTITSYYA